MKKKALDHAGLQSSTRRRFQADMLIGTYQLVLGDIVPVECFAKMTLLIEDNSNAGNRNQYKMQIQLVPSQRHLAR